jgi:hypothetical protein
VESSGEVKNVTGKYFRNCASVERENRFISLEKRKRLWDMSSELVHLNSRTTRRHLEAKARPRFGLALVAIATMRLRASKEEIRP